MGYECKVPLPPQVRQWQAEEKEQKQREETDSYFTRRHVELMQQSLSSGGSSRGLAQASAPMGKYANLAGMAQASASAQERERQQQCYVLQRNEAGMRNLRVLAAKGDAEAQRRIDEFEEQWRDWLSGRGERPA